MTLPKVRNERGSGYFRINMNTHLTNISVDPTCEYQHSSVVLLWNKANL